MSHTIIKPKESPYYFVLKRKTDPGGIIDTKDVDAKLKVVKNIFLVLYLSQTKPEVEILHPACIVKKGLFYDQLDETKLISESRFTPLINPPLATQLPYYFFVGSQQKFDGLTRTYFIEPKIHQSDLRFWIKNEEMLSYRQKKVPILPLSDLLFIALQMLTEVKLIHNLGHIHMDIKPANFMYDPEIKTVTIIDFGEIVKIGSIVKENRGTFAYGIHKKGAPATPKTDINPFIKIFSEMFVDYASTTPDLYQAIKEFSSLSLDEIMQSFTKLYWKYRRPNDGHCFLTSINQLNLIKNPSHIKHLVWHIPDIAPLFNLKAFFQKAYSLQVISLRGYLFPNILFEDNNFECLPAFATYENQIFGRIYLKHKHISQTIFRALNQALELKIKPNPNTLPLLHKTLKIIFELLYQSEPDLCQIITPPISEIEPVIVTLAQLYWKHRLPHDDHCFLTSEKQIENPSSIKQLVWYMKFTPQHLPLLRNFLKSYNLETIKFGYPFTFHEMNNLNKLIAPFSDIKSRSKAVTKYTSSYDQMMDFMRHRFDCRYYINLTRES